ncbi:MAG TPA: DUF4388 domain-containing protein [Candidatus Obscuribacterales bacterium]
MDSQSENSGGDVIGSLGWLIDRTNQEILGTMWMADNAAGVTCAHVVLPYVSILEALQVTFPATGYSCGIRQVEFHPDFDRWAAKRLQSQAVVTPSYDLISSRQNIAVVKLTRHMPQIDRDLLAKINAALTIPPPQEESIVSGEAGRLELTSMIQTLVNARNFGTLVLSDQRNRPLARLFLEDGKLTHAQFRNSYNETAIFRLITCQIEKFNFYFVPQVSAPWCNFAPVAKNTAFLLMDAYRRMEEQTQLMTDLGWGITAAVRLVPQVDFTNIPEDFQNAVAFTFSLIDPEIPISCIGRALSVDTYTILQSLKLLLDTGQIRLEARDPVEANSSLPLVMSEEPSMNAGDEIYALSIDPESRQAVIVRGWIAAVNWQDMEQHYVHTIALPPECAGSPLVKDGAVVGTHCGVLANQTIAGPFEPQICVASASVLACLGLIPTTPTQTSETLAAISEADVLAAQEQVESTMEVVQEEEKATPAAIQKISSFFSSIKGAVEGLKKAPPPLTGKSFQLSVLRRGIETEKFVKVPEQTSFKAGDMVQFEIVLTEDSHVYMIYKPSSEKQQLRVVYPYSKEEDKLLSTGTTLVVPQRSSSGTNVTTTGKFFLPGIMIPSHKGDEIVYTLFSTTPLADALFDEQNLGTTVANLLQLMGEEPKTEINSFPMHSVAANLHTDSNNNSVQISKIALTHQI